MPGDSRFIVGAPGSIYHRRMVRVSARRVFALALVVSAGCVPRAPLLPAPPPPPATKPVVIGILNASVQMGARVGGAFGVPEGSSAFKDYRWADNVPFDVSDLSAAARRGAFESRWRCFSGEPPQFVLESDLVDLAYDTYWDGNAQLIRATARVKVNWTLHVHSGQSLSILVSTSASASIDGIGSDRLVIAQAFEKAFLEMAADPAIFAALRE